MRSKKKNLPYILLNTISGTSNINTGVLDFYFYHREFKLRKNLLLPLTVFSVGFTFIFLFKI